MKRNVLALLHNSNFIGSAVCILNGDNYYIITAAHCIENYKPNTYVEDGIYVEEDIDFGKYDNVLLEELAVKQYYNKEETIYTFSEEDRSFRSAENDIILFVVAKSNFTISDIDEKLGIIVDVEETHDEKIEIFGFPSVLQNKEEFKGAQKKYSCRDLQLQNRNRFFCTSKKNKEYYQITGVSGGGVFFNNHFCGIETNFYEDTFLSVSLIDINEILKANSLNLIKSNYIPKTNSGITIGHLNGLFEKAKKGWLKERYSESIKIYGQIKKIVDEILFNDDYCNNVKNKIENYKHNLKTIEDFIKPYRDKINASSKASVSDYIFEMVEFVEQIMPVFYTYIGLFISYLESKDIEELIRIKEKEPDFNQLENQLSLIQKKYLAISSPSSKELQWFKFFDKKDFINETKLSFEQIHVGISYHNGIIFALPSAGKTHGTAQEVEKMLMQNFPSLMIYAPEIKSNSWKNILNEALDLNGHNSDNDILNDLTLIAESTKSKCLIVIDGIEESANIEEWVRRVDELEAMLDKFPLIRFLIVTRAYGSEKNPHGFDINNSKNRPFWLLNKSDANIDDIIKGYQEKYNIDSLDESYYTILKNQDPLLIRLFFEEYWNLDSNTEFSILKLMVLRLKGLSKEFRKDKNPNWDKIDDDTIMGMTLQTIADELVVNSQSERYNLSEKVSSSIAQHRNWAGILLEFFTKHGFITRLVKNGDRLIPAISYGIANQVYLDSLKSESIKSNQKSKDIPKNAPKEAKDNRNIAFKLGVSLLKDKDVWIGSEDYWVEDFEEEELLILRLEVLGHQNIHDSVLESKFEEIRSLFTESIRNRNIVFEYFIIPNLYREELELDIFLHEILLSFPNTFNRDLFWSTPEYGSGESDREESIGDILQKYVIENLLIYAWSLSSLNSVYIEHAVVKLTKLALSDISKFIELLDTVFFVCNDPQIQEGLSTATLGIATEITSPSSEFKALSNWVLINVFDDTKIGNLNNSVVRYCMRAVMERAFMLQLINREEVELARPPYNVIDKPIPLDFDFKLIEGGTGELDTLLYGDLAWYVIDKSYKGFFDSEKKDAVTFLRRNNGIGPGRFANAAAIAFAKKLGWYKREEPLYTTQKTHGSISEHMTLEEKYVWLAVHEIQGYLADRLSYENNNIQYERVPYYGIFLNVPNPAGGFEIQHTSEYYNDWYVPENFAPKLINKTEPTIEDWVKNKPYPTDISLWINIKEHIGNSKEWISLYMDTKLVDSTNTVGATLEGICCFMDIAKFSTFINDFQENYKNFKYDFDTISNFKARPNTEIYSSVRDLVWMNWRDERGDKVEVFGNIDILNTVTKVTEDSVSEGEQYFLIPSKIIRKELGIVDTNKKWFKDGLGSLKAIYHKKKSSDGYDSNHQEFLAVPKEDFYSITKKMGVQPFWIFWEFRRTTLATEAKKEKGGIEYHIQNSKMWLVWEENGEFKKFEYINSRFTND